MSNPFADWDNDRTDPREDLRRLIDTDLDQGIPLYFAVAGPEGDYLESGDFLSPLLEELADVPGDVAGSSSAFFGKSWQP